MLADTATDSNKNVTFRTRVLSCHALNLHLDPTPGFSYTVVLKTINYIHIVSHIQV